ncbi:MAG: transcriptional repressor, partial [Casimicrobiaceae bacterium]
MGSPQDLKSAGLKATLPRLKIINLFEASKVRHLTAEDVYKMLLA